MRKNQIVGLLIILSALLIAGIFISWIVILPLAGVTELVSKSITSGYWGIAVFTIVELLIVVLILIWIGSTALKPTNEEKEK